MTIQSELIEKRLYFLVPYNISSIQQAIQAGHAALEYARKFQNNEEFIDFVDNWKTWIILNGGTTNNNIEKPGTLQKTRAELYKYNSEMSDNINFSTFNEPDLNDALTAICFIADERVFNYDVYVDIENFLLSRIDKTIWFETFKNGPLELINIKNKFPTIYAEWENFLGGPKNVFLRYLIKGKKLA